MAKHTHTSPKYTFFLLMAMVGLAVVLLTLYVRGHIPAVLSPAGPIASQERNLIVFTVLLGMLVVVPVFALAIVIAWRYREGNTRARHTPDWDHSRVLESFWWGIPCAIILVLAIVTWISTYALSPYKPVASSKPPLTIQVVALQWKWLFIYPEQHVASVNFVQIPVDRPINFQVTADAPMNSFWIPRLGSQIYAMPGMSTQVHLLASQAGDYRGASANISGSGFAGMTFTARAGSQKDFDDWVSSVRRDPSPLDVGAYKALAAPSKDGTVRAYSAVDEDLYTRIIMSYMMPADQSPGMTMPGMPEMGAP